MPTKRHTKTTHPWKRGTPGAMTYVVAQGNIASIKRRLQPENCPPVAGVRENPTVTIDKLKLKHWRHAQVVLELLASHKFQNVCILKTAAKMPSSPPPAGSTVCFCLTFFRLFKIWSAGKRKLKTDCTKLFHYELELSWLLQNFHVSYCLVDFPQHKYPFPLQECLPRSPRNQL